MKMSSVNDCKSYCKRYTIRIFPLTKQKIPRDVNIVTTGVCVNDKTPFPLVNSTKKAESQWLSAQNYREKIFKNLILLLQWDRKTES